MRTFLALAVLLAACGTSTDAMSTTTTTESDPTTTSRVTTITTTPSTTTTAPVLEAIVLDNPVVRLTLPDGVIPHWEPAIAVSEDGWVVVAGDWSEKGVARDPGLWHTRDGVEWTVTRLSELVAVEFVEITDLVRYQGRFVASLMGDAAIIDPTLVVSNDGLTWTAESIDVGASAAIPGAFATPESPPYPGASAITDMAVHGDELVAVGWVSTDGGSSPAVWRTTDGRTWARSVLPNQVSPNEWASQISVGEAGYLVTGLGPFHQPDYLWSSTDGQAWKPVQLTKDFFVGHTPTVGDAMWALITFDDRPEELLRSEDGVEWEPVALPDVPMPQQSWGREMLVSGDEWLMLVNVEGQAGWMVSSAGDTFQYPLGFSQRFAEVLGHHVLVARSNDEIEIMPVHLGTSARVVDVASDDVLNVRAGPGVEHDIVATLGHQASDILVLDSADNGWQFILGPTGQVGWVNGVFLSSES